MSWQIAADIREMFVEVIAANGQTTHYGRNVSRKDQLTSGLAEALNGLPSGFKAQEASLYLRTDYERISLRERWGGQTALLVTEGFENRLEIDTQSRLNTFGLHPRKPTPLIGREAAFGVTERINADGSVEVGIDDKEIEFVMSKLAVADIKSVAICFLHSKINPQHENQLAETMKKNGYHVVCSHIFDGNELERAQKACADAFVWTGRQTLLTDIAKLGFAPEKIFLKPPLMNARSRESGLAKLEAALGVKSKATKETPLHCLFLEDRIHIEFDSAAKKVNTELSSSPLSKVLLDEGKLVHVGPERIDSEPGPVCFGKGIQLSALDLVAFICKLKNPRAMPRFKIDLARVAKQLVPLAKQLQLDTDTCAQKFLNLYYDKIAREISCKIAARLEPENLQNIHLVAGGWLATVMAAPLARRLGVKRMTVQPHAGWLNARLLMEAKPDAKSEESFWGTLEFENGLTAEGDSFEF